MDTAYDKKTVASFWFPCKMKNAHTSGPQLYSL